MERFKCRFLGGPRDRGNFDCVGYGWLDIDENTLRITGLKYSPLVEFGCLNLPDACCSSVCCLGCLGSVAFALIAAAALYLLPSSTIALPFECISNVRLDDRRLGFTALHPRTRKSNLVDIELVSSQQAALATKLLEAGLQRTNCADNDLV
jgi:hypothetical protein